MRWMRFGSFVLIALALVHSLSFLTAPPPPVDGNEARMIELMKIPRAMMGVQRGTFDLLRGFLISFSVLPLTMGIAGLAAARSDDRRTARSVAGVFCLGLAAMTVVSVIWWFPAPTAFLAVAALLFGVGWMQPGGDPSRLHYYN